MENVKFFLPQKRCEHAKRGKCENKPMRVLYDVSWENNSNKIYSTISLVSVMKFFDTLVQKF